MALTPSHTAWLRHLTDLLKHLVGKKSTHIQNSKDLVDKLEHIELEEGEILTSFDVIALFTSLPGKEVVQMAIQQAKRDPMSSNGMLMTAEEFGDLLHMVVDTTYFRFNGRIYKQTYGMARGLPLPPVLANLFMEEFEEKAIAKAPHPPKFGGRYIDDTGVVIKKEYEDELFQQIN